MKKLKAIIELMIIFILLISCNAADKYLGINEDLLEEEEEEKKKDDDGGSVAFSPRSISNLELWLDASDASTITTSGIDVTQWNDKSGNSNNFTQANALYQPNVNATGINSKSTITFIQTGGGQANKLSGPTIDCLISTIFIVYRPSTDISYYFLGYSTSYRISVSAANTFNLVYTGTTAESITINSVCDNNPHILMVKIRNINNKFIVSLDGDVEINSVNDIAATKTDYLFNTIGAVNNASTAVLDLFNGDMAEIVIYTTILSTSDKEKIEGYLAWKWGLTGSLPPGHPYKTVAP